MIAENTLEIVPGGSAQGTIHIPGDKSISIRAVLFAALADGVSSIRGLGSGEDIQSALNCVQKLGIYTETSGSNSIIIEGNGLYGFNSIQEKLDCGNSGTTLRLLTGILAGQRNSLELTGDASLQQRPMNRILIPLRKMGADIICSGTDGNLLYTVNSAQLQPITYELPVASAQVKSAVLLAGLYAHGTTTVIEPLPSRDHTERLLSSCGVPVQTETSTNSISITGIDSLMPFDLTIPGDISGAAFFAVLACLLPGSHLTIKNVGMNKTRTGIIDVLRLMGADIEEHSATVTGGEEIADLVIKSSKLKGITISGDIIPRVIDELPIIAVAGAFSEGKTEIRDAQELRVKETDRIHALCKNLENMGVDVEELSDGLIISSNRNRHSAEFDSFGDHRIAMAFAVAGTALDGNTSIKEGHWANISFPGFYDLINSIRK